MSQNEPRLLQVNLKQLRLPMILAEYEKLAAEAAQQNADYTQYLLRLVELEVAQRSANALKSRIKQAAFPAYKDFDTYDFSVIPSLNKQQVLESATGKTHLAIGLGLAACRQGRKVRFFTAASLVNRLEEAQKQYQLDKFLTQLDKADLLICDELGYLSFSRRGADDRGLIGSPDASLPYLRDERRELPVSRVGEEE